jgi:hypothetical protein
MYSSKIIILFILTICIVSSHEIYTKTQLRGLYQHHMNKLLNEQIQYIVERVVAFAQINHTSYTHAYSVDSKTIVGGESSKILLKFSDEKILSRLQITLIDANITISEPKCCNPACDKTNIHNTICKFIVINW